MTHTKYFFFFLIFLGFSCGREKKEDEFTICGEFSNSHGDKVVFGEMDVKAFIPLDSAKTGPGGTISFSFLADQPGFYILQFPEGRRMILLMGKKEHLMVKGNMQESLENFTLSGSKGSELLQTFFRATARNKARVDSVKSVLMRNEGSENFLRISMSADSVFSRISEDQKRLEKDFIDRNPQSLASLVVLNYSFGLKPVLTLESDLPYYQKLKNLSRQYPTNKHVIYHLKRMNLYQGKSTIPEN
jgi:hypothetical protein